MNSLQRQYYVRILSSDRGEGVQYWGTTLVAGLGITPSQDLYRIIQTLDEGRCQEENSPGARRERMLFRLYICPVDRSRNTGKRSKNTARNSPEQISITAIIIVKKIILQKNENRRCQL